VTERAGGRARVLRHRQPAVQQVLRNLLSNAFKFTEQGQVTVSVHKADNNEKRVALRCTR